MCGGYPRKLWMALWAGWGDAATATVIRGLARSGWKSASGLSLCTKSGDGSVGKVGMTGSSPVSTALCGTRWFFVQREALKGRAVDIRKACGCVAGMIPRGCEYKAQVQSGRISPDCWGRSVDSLGGSGSGPVLLRAAPFRSEIVQAVAVCAQSLGMRLWTSTGAMAPRLKRRGLQCFACFSLRLPGHDGACPARYPGCR